MPVRLPARAADGIPALPAITVHGPHGLVEEPDTTTRRVSLALEGDSNEARRHLLDERRGGGGELEEEDGVGAGLLLDGEGDVAFLGAEEGAGDAAAEGGGGGGGGEVEPAAGGEEERWDGEETEDGAEEGGDGGGGFSGF